jgi:hypothetical protein
MMLFLHDRDERANADEISRSHCYEITQAYETFGKGGLAPKVRRRPLDKREALHACLPAAG